MLFSDARFRVINLQFKRDGEGGGGLERPRVNTIKRKETFPQNNPNFNFGVISEDQSFLYLCWPILYLLKIKLSQLIQTNYFIFVVLCIFSDDDQRMVH